MSKKEKKTVIMECPYCFTHYDSDIGCTCRCPHYTARDRNEPMVCDPCIQREINELKRQPAPLGELATNHGSVTMTPQVERSLKHVIRDAR